MADDIIKEFLVESSENLAVSVAEKANRTVSKLGSSSAESGEIIKASPPSPSKWPAS